MNLTRLRILRFILLSLVLGSLLSGVVLITASNLIHNKQQNQIQLVEQFTYSNLGDNAKLLSRQLRAAVELEFLTITDNSGNVLYRYIQPELNTPFITPLLRKLSIHTEPTSLISSNGELYIEFHSSYDEFLQPFTFLLFIMFFSPSVILGLNTFIKLVNSNQQNVSNEPQSKEPSDTAKPSTRDKLTGLPTGPEFIDYYQNFMQTQPNLQQGYFVLIRATQLQYLNFNLGYPAGDRYIQLIGQAITSQIAKDHSLQAFKLNGFDFGLLLPNYTQEQTEHLLSQIGYQFKSTFLEQNVSTDLTKVTMLYNETTSLSTLLSQADAQADVDQE